MLGVPFRHFGLGDVMLVDDPSGGKYQATLWTNRHSRLFPLLVQRIAGFHIVAIVHHHRQAVGIVVIDHLSGHMGSHRLFRICFAQCQCRLLTRSRVIVVI